MPFKIAGKLSLDGTSFKAGIAKAKASVQGLGAKMKSAMASPMAKMAGAMAVAMIGAQVKKTIDWGTRLRDLGVMFGVSTKWLQKMEYAATQTGGNLETMMKSYKKMLLLKAKIENKMTSKLSREQYADYFATLGVSLKQLKSLGPTQLFDLIAQNVKKMDTSALAFQESYAMIFGKGSGEMINMMRVGVQGLTEDFEAMGASVDEETIERLGAQGDKMEEMSLRWRTGWADALAYIFNVWDHFSAMLTATMDAMADRMVALSEFRILDTLAMGMPHAGEIATRQRNIMAAKQRQRDKDKAARDVTLKAQGKQEDPDDEVAAAEAQEKAKEKAEASKKRMTELERRQAGWRGFGATSLEKIGGGLGMKTTQLNVAQQQLALMKKAELGRVALANNVAKIKNEVAP